MKIKELFHLDKALLERKKELEKLKEEAERLKLKIKNKNDEISRDRIDIKDVYVYQNIESNVKFFVQKKRNTKLYDNNFPLILTNIFTGEIVESLYNSDFIRAQERYSTKFTIKHIGDVYPELNAYPNNMVPKVLLQELYCHESSVDEYKKNTEKENQSERKITGSQKLELQLLAEDNENCAEELIDISNIHVYRSSIRNPIYFIKLKEIANSPYPIKLIDIFSDHELNCCNMKEFLESQDRVLQEDSSKFEFSTRPIIKVYPELENYSNNMVPKEILEELLCRINHINQSDFKYKIKK